MTTLEKLAQIVKNPFDKARSDCPVDYDIKVKKPKDCPLRGNVKWEDDKVCVRCWLQDIKDDS